MKNLQEALNSWIEKRDYLENELSIVSPVQKFELRARISECEQEIARIKGKINSEQANNLASIKQGFKRQTNTSMTPNQETSMRDVFICHASEDKPLVVEPLVSALQQASISYWYDKAEIKWGDSITKKVNEGLSISRYVIVVLSSAFLNKKYPQRELNSVLNVEASSGEVKVLPLIIAKDSQEEQAILQRFPLLGDKAFKTWNNSTQEIVEVLRTRLSIPK
ncbi:MAG: toll/interleukin-1 receptor domain-containing protein [Cyanobacteria bacterium P01_G01_bin.39]